MKNLAFLYLSFALIIISCKKETSSPPPPPTYPVTTVSKQNVMGYIDFPAEIEGEDNVIVRPKISGYINQVLVEEGDIVSVGQPLFKLETNVLSQNVNAAKSQISSANANIRAAEANVKSAQVEVNKLVPLVQKGIISSIQLETAKANLLKAQSQLSQAQANSSMANANYNGVYENLRYATVTSSISGIVGKINVGKGDLVGPSDSKPLTTLSNTRNINAIITLNEKQFLSFMETAPGKGLKEKIKNIPDITLELANGKDYQYKGKIISTTGQTDSKTGTIQFKVAFQNPDGLLSNGSTGKVKIPKYYKNVIVIPEAATFEQQGIIYAYKVEKDTVKLTNIELTDRINNLAIVKNGLFENEKIVTAGVNNLKNKTLIKPQLVKLDSLINTIKAIK